MLLERLIIGSVCNAGLICVLLPLKRILRCRLTMRFQYCIWYLIFGSLFLSFLPDLFLPKWKTDAQARQAFMLSATTQKGAAAHSGKEWLMDTLELADTAASDQLLSVLLLIWVLGVLLVAAIYCSGSIRLNKIRRHTQLPNQSVLKQYSFCCKRLRVLRPPVLCLSKELSAPVSFGLCRAFVVLPEKAVQGLSEQELEHILLHELSHIQHGDLMTNSLFCVAQALFWFDPVVWFALRQMRRDREAYCDWEVMQILRGEKDRLDYGQTILRFAAKMHDLPWMANGFCTKNGQLKYRLEQIVEFHGETNRGRWIERGLVFVLALICLVQLPLLATCAERESGYYAPVGAVTMEDADWDALFSTEGCAVLYDLNADQYIVYNKDAAVICVPPCSTYKIFSALNALETGIITAGNSRLAWDGTQYDFPAWNQSHDLHSAMQNSVNWYFQALDQAVGAAEMEHFFRRIGYGDCNIGTDADGYWNGTGIRISPLEQVELLRKLYRNDFGFAGSNVAAVKEAMALDSAGLYGKTGTGRLDGINVAGWFVGFLEQSDNTLFIAVYVTDEKGADGAMAYRVAMEILNQRIS